MKHIVICALLALTSQAKATCTPVAPTKTETLTYYIESCLDRHVAELCVISGLEAEKLNRLTDATTFYKLACSYGDIPACGHKTEAFTECREQQRAKR